MMNKLLILLIFIFPGIFSVAQQTLPPLKFTLYKSGMAHIVREGTLKFDKGHALLDGSVNPLMGTYWLSGNKDMNIQFLMDTVQVKRQATDIQSLIKSNPGKNIHLSYSYKHGGENLQTLAGEILEFNPKTQLLKLKTAEGNLFMHLSSINILSIRFNGEEKSSYYTDSVFRVARVNTTKNTPTQDVQLHYMRTGFNWHPSYYLKLMNNKEARLEMKALVENFAEPLENVETDLVIGEPFMFFGSALDPMVNSHLTGQGTRPQPKRQRGAAIESSKSEVMMDADYFEETFTTAGDKNMDLFHYKLGKISIPQNSKVYYPIFADKVQYQELYETVIGDYVSFHSSQRIPVEERTYEVTHYVKIKNTTSFPLTTGPIIVENEKHEFLSQDQLEYTPVGHDNKIKLAKAGDVIVTNTEEEGERELNVKRLNNYNYSKAYIRGQVSLENFQKKAITVFVRKDVTGEITDSKGGKIHKKFKSKDLNPSSYVIWEIDLKPGEKKVVTYDYMVYFKSR